MKRKLMIVLLLVIASVAGAQQNPQLVDSFQKKLSRATTSAEKVDIMGTLSRILMNTNMAEADRYGKLVMQEAELSRDRKLMFKALMFNGDRYSYFVANKNLIQTSVDYYNRALELARKEDLDEERAEALLSLSAIQRQIPDLEKANSYVNQASSIVSMLDNDSLNVVVQLSTGNIYLDKKERLLALQSYLYALTIAEEMKKKNPDILRSCYYSLSNFYAGIKEYDKAIDYAKQSMDQLQFVKSDGVQYNRVVDLFSLGNLYSAKKNFDMSQYFYERSISLADSLKYEPLKVPGYNGLLNQYIRANQPQKALDYFNTNLLIKKYLTSFGYGHMIDQAYGVIFTELGRYDSARFYFEKALPVFEKSSSLSSKLSIYMQYGDFLDKSGNMPGAIEYYLKAKNIAEQTSDIESEERIAKELDSAYTKTGDYRQSYFYNTLHDKLKDSIQKLGEEKDLLQMELKDAEQRRLRQEREKEEALNRKHNLEYTGITIGIAVIFLLLVLMGAFRVSEATIKVMGFFAFILLFEFITLLADTKIHHWTEGEPLKVLAIKVVLIAMLLPLHHWLEHKVITYLASRRLIIPDRKSIWNILAKRKSVNT
jgi:tetratricopeptide (TPR) repeat protein